MISRELLQANAKRWEAFQPEASKEILNCLCERVSVTPSESGSINASVVVDGKTYLLNSEVDPMAEATAFVDGLGVEKVSAIYLYGIGCGYIFEALKSWLLNEMNVLIILERDLDVIAMLLSTACGTEIVHHPRVWLYHLTKSMSVIDMATELCVGLAYRVAISPVYQQLYQKDAYDCRVKIDFYTNARNGFLTEYRSSGRGFFFNYFRNLFLYPSSHLGPALKDKFRGVPAIICGAGPSLSKQKDLLKALKDRALIFAGGTAMNGVNAFQFNPHVGVGIDPNMAQLSRIIMNTAYEVPFLYRSRIYTHALQRVHGPRVFVPGSSGYKISEYFERAMDVPSLAVSEGHNVINFSLSIASALGCSPIILVGVDLAYTEGSAYAEGVINHPIHHRKELFNTKSSEDELIIRNDIYGKPVKTLWKWVNESLWFAQFAAQHPEIELINATEGGLGFLGVPNIPLKEVADEYLKNQIDVELILHREIQNGVMPDAVSERKITELLLALNESLKRCMELLLEPIEDACLKSKEDTDRSDRANQLHAEIAYTFVLEDFNNAYHMIRKGDLKRIEIEQSLNGEDLVAEKIANFNKDGQTILKSVCRSVSQQIEDICASHNEKHNVVNEDLSFRLLSEDVLKGRYNDRDYHFDDHEYVIEDFQNDLLYSEHFDILTSPIKEQAFYDNGTIKEISYRRDHFLHGPSTVFSDSGQMLGRSWFCRGVRVGRELRYYLNGQINAELFYKNGALHGKQIYFNLKGLPRSEMSYVDGVLDGEVRLYYPSGIRSRELHFVAGKRYGFEKIWNEASMLMIEAEFDADQPIGVARVWHDNGALAYENDYGVKGGMVRMWDRYGNPLEDTETQDYFVEVAKGADKLTGEICTIYEQICMAIPQLVPSDKQPAVIELLAGIGEKVMQLKDMNNALKNEAGVGVSNGKEAIWKTPALERELESMVFDMAEDMKGDFNAIQEALLKILGTPQE